MGVSLSLYRHIQRSLIEVIRLGPRHVNAKMRSIVMEMICCEPVGQSVSSIKAFAAQVEARMGLIVNLVCVAFVVVFVSAVSWPLWVSIPVGVLLATVGAFGFGLIRGGLSR